MKKEKKSSASRSSDGARRSTNELVDRTDRNAISEALTGDQRNVSDHLCIGMLFASAMQSAVTRYTAEHGDTQQNRSHVMDALHALFAREFERTRAAVRLYIRCYQHFDDGTNKSALTLREMALRPGSSPACA
jgi:hypothetical protein